MSGAPPYTAIYMVPAPILPGATITNAGTWDQRDCSEASCVQVPSGTYVVVAKLSEGGSYLAHSTFHIGG